MVVVQGRYKYKANIEEDESIDLVTGRSLLHRHNFNWDILLMFYPNSHFSNIN